MNICVFSIVTYWHGLKGGMEIHGKHLFEGLTKKGHNVFIISTKHPSGETYKEVNGLRIHFIQHTTFGSPRKGWKRESTKRFKEILGENRIDIVVSQSRAGYGISSMLKKLNIPLITIMHGYQTMIISSLFNQVLNFKAGYMEFVKRSLGCIYYSVIQEYPLLINSSAIIVPSNKVAGVFARRPFIAKKKIKTVNHGVDLSVFQSSDEQRDKKRKLLNFSGRDRVILFLSIVSMQKGADIALKAFRILHSYNQDIKLILAGDGEYLSGAKNLAQKLGIAENTCFPGFIPNSETFKYYNAADIFIFPTLRYESFGIVLAEAMACGKPIVASKIGSIPDVIEDGKNGVLFPPGDYKELAKNIYMLLNDDEYAGIIAKNAREKAQEFYGLDRMVNGSINVFELAMGSD